MHYKKSDYVPSDDEIINKLFPLDKHINDLVTLNGKVAAMEQLVKENYDLKGKYRHFFEGGRLPSRMTVNMIDQYLGETGQNSPMEKGTMEAYTRRMTAELAKVTQRHIEETIAQGVAQNWSRGRKQEELRKRFLEEQAKRPELDMAKAFPNVETVVRTESMKIMGAEAWKSASESYEKGRIWGFTYNAVGDSRTRETHLAQDDCSAPFEDPFWDEWTPPNGYNCRCWLTRESEEPDNIRPPHRELKPDKGFAFNPAKRINGPSPGGRTSKQTPKLSSPVPLRNVLTPIDSAGPNMDQNRTAIEPKETIAVEDWYAMAEPVRQTAPGIPVQTEPKPVSNRKEVQPLSPPEAKPFEVKPTGSGYVVEQDGKTAGSIVKLSTGKYVAASGTMVKEVKTKAEAVRAVEEQAGKNTQRKNHAGLGFSENNNSESPKKEHAEPEFYTDYFNQNDGAWERDNANGRGNYIPADDIKEKYELEVIEKFLSSGYNVEDIPKSKIPGEKTADHLIRQFLVEVKELTVVNENRIISDIRDGMHQHAQIVLIAAWNIDISKEVINHAIIRFRGQRPQKVLPVEVWFWTKEGCIKYKKEE